MISEGYPQIRLRELRLDVRGLGFRVGILAPGLKRRVWVFEGEDCLCLCVRLSFRSAESGKGCIWLPDREF